MKDELDNTRYNITYMGITIMSRNKSKLGKILFRVDPWDSEP